MRTPVPLLLVLLAFVPAPLFALSVGPEILLSPPAIEPLAFWRTSPGVASNGSGFLVVWMEESSEVRAARVDQYGALTDVKSFPVGIASGISLSVASDGRDYIVAYNCRSQTETSVCLSRVEAVTGTVFQTGRLTNGYEASVASNGDGYLVAYRATRAPFQQSSFVDAVALHGDGSVAGAPFHVTNALYQPGIASNGDRYLVLVNNYATLKTVLVDETGTVGPIRTLTDGGAPGVGPSAFGWWVASDGEDFMVAWQQNTGVVDYRYTTDLRLQPISAEGIAGERRTIGVANGWAPSVTWMGSRYLVMFSYGEERSGAPYPGSQDLDVRAVTVTKSGDDAMPLVLSAAETTETTGAAAFNGTATLVVWSHLYRDGAAEIEGRLLRNGQIAADSAPAVYSRGLTHQDSLVAARIGGRTVTAWSENRGTQQIRKVFVQRLDERGFPPAGAAIPAADSGRDQIHPALGGSALAWIDADPEPFSPSAATVYIRFFDADGRLQPPVPLGPAMPRSRVSVAAAGSVHLVTWELAGNIVAMRVSPSSGPLDAEPFVVADLPRIARNPVVASDGSDFFVAWNVEGDGCDICYVFYSVHAAAVSRFGVVTRAPFEVADSGSDPKVAWNGSEYALFWARSGGGAFAQAFSEDGDALGVPRELPTELTPHAVTSLGGEYLVAFDHPESPRWISLLRLDRNFGALETLPVYSAFRPESSIIALAAQRDGSAILAYLSGTNEDRNASRAVARRVAAGDAFVPRRRAVR
ncbi:MAG TPA: hypothetical protein VEK57_20925 [Thermoanaerobaculia bacterium]|nr:hypothetical protein [Thermoanaerobaculia bacterium]